MRPVTEARGGIARLRLGTFLAVLIAVACSGDDLLTVAAPPTITSAELAPGTVGVTYTVPLTASGGQPPYTWSIASGSLPDGLALAEATGTISGTPTAAGTARFAVGVTGKDGSRSTKDMLLTIEPILGAALIGVRVAGNGSDPDGCSVTAGGRVYEVAAGDTLCIEHLNPGILSVALGGLAQHRARHLTNERRLRCASRGSGVHRRKRVGRGKRC